MIPFIKRISNLIYDNKKKAFFIFLFLVLYFGGPLLFNNNPNVDKNDKQYVNSIYMSDGRMYNEYLNDKEKEAYDFIMDRIKRNKTVTKLTPREYGCESYSECSSLWSTAVNAIWIDHPELLSFASYNWSYRNGLLTFRIKRSFKLPLMDKFGEMIINYKINKIVEATKGMTDKEKIIYVYNWIGENATYDRIFTFDNKNQTIYNVFINHNAVCAGFAKASQVIFQRLGIKSYIITGNTTGPHMWNIVEVDGKAYYFDSTVAACIKPEYRQYYDGLRQSEFLNYQPNSPEKYPTLETTELFSEEDFK